MIAVRFLPYALSALAVLGAIWWVYDSVWDAGYARCESEHATKSAQAVAASLDAYNRAVANANEISARLAAAQTEIKKLRSRHADVARSIPGVCPDSLRAYHDAAAAGDELPVSSGSFIGSPGLVAASQIATAIGENYADCRGYAEQLNALIDWHTRADK